jgi:2'-5' RNA ligase
MSAAMIERRNGTYAKLVPSESTKQRIAQFVDLINLENPASVHDLHVTIVYSRKACPEIEFHDTALPALADGAAFDIFPNQDGSKCLVLKLASKQIHDLHEIIREQYGATHDFPSFQPHITLSYDYTQVTTPESGLDYFKDLQFDQYVVEPLDLNWKSE